MEAETPLSVSHLAGGIAVHYIAGIVGYIHRDAVGQLTVVAVLVGVEQQLHPQLFIADKIGIERPFQLLKAQRFLVENVLFYHGKTVCKICEKSKHYRVGVGYSATADSILFCFKTVLVGSRNKRGRVYKIQIILKSVYYLNDVVYNIF